MTSTRPLRLAVHGHRAGTAHADAAGEAVGERGIQHALDVGDDIEHGLARMARHFESLEGSFSAAAPDLDFQAVQEKFNNSCAVSSGALTIASWPVFSSTNGQPGLPR